MEAKFSQKAVSEIDQLFEYYQQYSPKFVNRIADELYDHKDKLAEFPELGKVIDINFPNERIFSLNSIEVYIVYKIYPETDLLIIQSVLRQEQMIGWE